MNERSEVFVLLTTGLICYILLFFHSIEPAGSKLLGVGFISSVYNDKLSKFNCPGIGNYPVRDNCSQYFHCDFPGYKPNSIYECKGSMKFHQMTRRCESATLVDCKLCRTRGIFKDKTSKHHFIKCERGQLAERYKCPNETEFQFGRMECFQAMFYDKSGPYNTKIINLNHSSLDPPSNLAKFMKKWRKVEMIEKTLKKKPKLKKIKHLNIPRRAKLMKLVC